MKDIIQISPHDLKKRLDNGRDFVLVDVRETYEWNLGRIEGAMLKPMSEIMEWIDELEPDREYVFLCHHGNRSYQACAFASDRQGSAPRRRHRRVVRTR